MYAAGCSVGESEGVEAMSGCRRAATAAVVGALTFGAVLLGGAGAAGAEGSVPGGEVTALQAQEAAQRTDPALLAASSSASLEGQPVAPAIGDSGEELSATGTLTGSTISKETPGQFALNTSDGELSLTPVLASSAASTPTIVNGAAAVFADTWPATDTIVRPQPLGVTSILQIRSAQAPSSFSWEIGLGPGQQLEQLSNGSVAVVDTPIGSTLENPLPSGLEASGESSNESQATEEEAAASESQAAEEAPLPSTPLAPQASTPSAPVPAGQPEPQETQAQYTAATSSVAAAQEQTLGATLMVIDPPTVTDAAGSNVPSTLIVAGNTITVSVTPAPATVFPVEAAMTVAAPSNHASAARAPKLIYGLSDQRLGVFGPAFDSRLLEAETPLHVQVARLIVPYELALESVEKQEAKEKTEKKIEYTQNERLAKWLQGVAEVKNAKGEELLKPYITLWSKSCLEGETCSAPPIKRYRKAVRALIKRYMKPAAGLPAVTLWGAWNEPNLAPTPMRSAKAGELWQVAHSVMTNLHCGCTMVAGEFSGVEAQYVERYKKYMVKHHLTPHAWGMHDYHDLIEVEEPLSSYKNRDAEELARITKTKVGNPRIWLSEQGVQLKNENEFTRLHDNPELQRISAEDFLALAGASTRTELVDYYQYAAPELTTAHPHPEEEEKAFFDSALRNEKGEPRPAYCVLAYKTEKCPGPTAETGGAEQVAISTVRLKGYVNPNGDATTYKFEWGTRVAGEYGSSTTVEPAGSGTSRIEVSALIGEGTSSDVRPDVVLCQATIHYRLVATSPAGTSQGLDHEFTGCV
jgi:hypothetical protein